MFVRICRYRVLPGMMDRYLAVQQQASRVYAKYVPHRAAYFQSAHDPHEWLEVHRYVDEAACRSCAERINRDPEIARLWEDFQQTLDPHFPPVIEEYLQRPWITGQGADGDAERTGA